MGISGLLPQLKSIVDHINIKELSGRKVAVDAYCWLHKGTFSCATELCLGLHTRAYVGFFLRRIHLLLNNGVIPFIVFDGARLPLKGGTEASRLESRERNKKRGEELHRQGNRTAAMKCFQKAVDVTPAMAFQVILELRKLNIEYCVAPYEADAQLAYLCRNKIVDAVISEDSDLLVFGCERVIFKMDKTGAGQQICLSKLGFNTKPSFHNWSHTRFQKMCILSGCDYLANVPSVGLTIAYKLLSQCNNVDRVVRKLQFQGKKVPKEYLQGFKRALTTFQHQRVFDPRTRTIVHLTKLPGHIEKQYTDGLDFLGPHIDDELARQIADGTVDPETHEPFPLEDEDDMSSFSPFALAQRSKSAPAGSLLKHAKTKGNNNDNSNNNNNNSLFHKGFGKVTPYKRSKPESKQKNTLDSFFLPKSPKVLRDFVPPSRLSMDAAKTEEEEEEDKDTQDKDRYPPTSNPFILRRSCSTPIPSTHHMQITNTKEQMFFFFFLECQRL